MAEIIFSPGTLAAAYCDLETADTRRGDVEDDSGIGGITPAQKLKLQTAA